MDYFSLQKINTEFPNAFYSILSFIFLLLYFFVKIVFIVS